MERESEKEEREKKRERDREKWREIEKQRKMFPKMSPEGLPTDSFGSFYDSGRKVTAVPLTTNNRQERATQNLRISQIQRERKREKVKYNIYNKRI